MGNFIPQIETMENLITYLSINNFKSIKELELKDCRRVNLFIGKPNTGKSNILEALSMFCGPMTLSHQSFLSPFVRFNNYNDLFTGNDIKNPIYVKTNFNSVRLRWHFANAFEFIIDTDEGDIMKLLPQDLTLGEIQNIFHQEVSKYGSRKSKTTANLFFKVLSSEKNNEDNKGIYYNYLSTVRKYFFQKGIKHDNPFSVFLVTP
ncbi:MAG: AAA family ATPase, partial [Chitinophagales bacterium]